MATIISNYLKYLSYLNLYSPPIDPLMGPERLLEIVSPLRQRFLLVEFQELEQMLEKYKSKESKKAFADVKRELMKLEQPPGLKESYKSANS